MSAAVVTPISGQNPPIRFSRCVEGLSQQELNRAAELDHQIFHLRLELEKAVRERSTYPAELIQVFGIPQ